MTIQDLFKLTIEKQASDLHIIPGYYPSIRINSELYQLKVNGIMSGEDTKKYLTAILTEEQKENLYANKEIDFGIEFEGYRFRANVYFTSNELGGAFRLIGNKIKTIDELQLPKSFHDWTHFNQGLILITGPTGEGKTTTLASMLNEINLTYAKHIVTIEDPIEYIYPKAKSIVSQRELHTDTHSWTVALKSVLREDPDIVLLGEMRDYDTIQMALTIAETGHLVFSTLHTGSTPEAINRIIDVFPTNQQGQIRAQLSSVLKAVVAQRLIPHISGTKRIPAVEILLNIPSVASIIRESKIFMLDNVLETEEEQGLRLFEKRLLSLYQSGEIDKKTALSSAIRPTEMAKLIK